MGTTGVNGLKFLCLGNLSYEMKLPSHKLNLSSIYYDSVCVCVCVCWGGGGGLKPALEIRRSLQCQIYIKLPNCKLSFSYLLQFKGVGGQGGALRSGMCFALYSEVIYYRVEGKGEGN